MPDTVLMCPNFVDRLRSGDDAAFDHLAQLYGARLRGIANRVVGCQEIAAEVVQEVLFRLWRDRETLLVREHLGGYLARAVRNRALDLVKRNRLESRWRERELADPPPPVAPVDRAADEWDAAVQRALDELPPRRREAVLLRWRDGLSYQEIAVALAISPKTVENQIGRALKTLRAALDR